VLKIKPEYLSKRGKREFVVLTIEDFDRMQAAIDDARDLRMLREATSKNSNGRYFTPQEVTRKLASRPIRGRKSIPRT
jgi:hypothetical protein